MSDPTLWRHAKQCAFERGEVGEHDCDCGLFAYRAALSATSAPDPTWCREHHAYDHCEDATLAALSTTPAPLDLARGSDRTVEVAVVPRPEYDRLRAIEKAARAVGLDGWLAGMTTTEAPHE